MKGQHPTFPCTERFPETVVPVSLLMTVTPSIAAHRTAVAQEGVQA